MSTKLILGALGLLLQLQVDNTLATTDCFRIYSITKTDANRSDKIIYWVEEIQLTLTTIELPVRAV